MPTHLYQDVVEPLHLAGYASVFGIDYLIDGGAAWERIARNAFVLGARPVALCIAHDGDRRYASTRDRSLCVWADHHGLAFEARVAWGAAALTLARGIRRDEFTGVSVGFAKREVEIVSAGDREIEVVRKAEIDEISLTWAPACQVTSCWLTDDPQDELPAHVAAARAHWEFGRMQARFATRWPHARASAQVRARARAMKPVCPPSVVDVLDRYYPLRGHV